MTNLRDVAAQLREEAQELLDTANQLEKTAKLLEDRGIEGVSVAQPKPPAPSPQPDTSPLVPELRMLPWGKQAAEVHEDFIDGCFWIEEKLGLRVEPLLTCMKFESNLDPKARNPGSSASGLIQFMSATATSLGTTIEKIRAMDAMGQLGYVYKYFKDFTDRGYDLSKWSICDTYLAILYPKAIGLSEESAVFVRGSSTYRVNSGLDTDKDGYVTKREICARIKKLFDTGLNELHVLHVER